LPLTESVPPTRGKGKSDYSDEEVSGLALRVSKTKENRTFHVTIVGRRVRLAGAEP
jgi:hypothetical protein